MNTNMPPFVFVLFIYRSTPRIHERFKTNSYMSHYPSGMFQVLGWSVGFRSGRSCFCRLLLEF
ncbi:hypothetical protein HanPI659440_Chr12g0453341 [Helianthus annuus]|nr:hypothetical protein HanPI659440_Chr12g0453341 [Helianthus annuus]